MAQSQVFRPVFSLSPDDVLRHAPHEVHRRHRHKDGFTAVVLQGGYTEVGDTGVWRVEQGDVIAHAPFEAHHNYAGANGAKVLLLPMFSQKFHPLASIDDPDEVIRLASRSLADAAEYVACESQPKALVLADEVDLLAGDIRKNPALRIGRWCEINGVDPSVASRSFRKRFQCTAQQYRLAIKVRIAIDAIMRTRAKLSCVAQDSGFADQAHMCRAVYAHTGFTPVSLRNQDLLSGDRRQ